VQRQVRRDAFGLDVDEQREGVRIAGVDRAAMALDQLAQRFEVQRLQGAAAAQVFAVMADEQLAVDEPDVRLDALELIAQRVVQRALVLIVVVGVRPLQTHRAATGGRTARG